ncbi:hypothetical protein DMN91_001897 [Ooceraea biroi]|uniref:Nuclease HARBI1 n=1 Tax=Ooceraea biroi TaxID=2015173 RepID=A0A3L8E0M6_OOCBI|nr:hypothetical protein DMN91_001897 [Ooceraea biroi]
MDGQMDLISQNVIHIAMDLINSSSSVSESDDSSDEEPLLLDDIERVEVPEVKNYCTTISRLHDTTFQLHFRLTRGSFEVVRRTVGPMLQPNNNKGSNVLLEKAILSTLWLLANQDSFREIGNLFDLSKSTAHKVFRDVCNALCNTVNEHLHWPNPAEFESIR